LGLASSSRGAFGDSSRRILRRADDPAKAGGNGISAARALCVKLREAPDRRTRADLPFPIRPNFRDVVCGPRARLLVGRAVGASYCAAPACPCQANFRIVHPEPTLVEADFRPASAVRSMKTRQAAQARHGPDRPCALARMRKSEFVLTGPNLGEATSAVRLMPICGSVTTTAGSSSSSLRFA
jgi:hypothetical protein